ncbi:glycosyltransferase family 4 protein [Gulosibacter chungangensis]|uniref:Glycosyltransferase family 4 protein n=1 Tax=Gulosibacter chungangensis TaxID=979746 RepID=A0A7J5B7D3_9MICO|nr:glycosyltransferase family 4 protein [Gulosibacter chungangensis]KAB1640828.1 glycosyltransferase family 4 protein [Gulosibacter chungangensis]
MSIKNRINAGLRVAGTKTAKAAAALGRRLPDGMKSFAKDKVKALPQNKLTNTLRSVAAAPPQNAPLIGEAISNGHMVPLQAAGSTYSEAQISTFLQYELSYLKQLYFQMSEQHGFDAERDVEESSEESLILAQQYLDSFSPSAGSTVRHLVVVEVYPREGAEYGNGFVHRRVKLYQEGGAEVHVAVVSRNATSEIFEYDGVTVIAGQGQELAALLQRHEYESVSTHFMSEYLWQKMAPYLDGQRLYCYIHGFEARRWVRSLHNYRSSDALERELATSLRRQQFWRRVLAHPNGPVKYVFVSQWWRNAAQEDLELTIPTSKTEVIHNLVDTSLFRYMPKSADQRFKILWVRTANNFNYGSDIAVRVLKALRETPYWSKLDVKIVGDGRYFGEFESTFAEDANVHINRGFINQTEIARLHREYGIFLVPTRLDTQGVSRDEAMASGLVPITNAVAAVPEFVNDEVAVLAGPEDVEGMVAGMIALFKSAERFQKMSRLASERVASQSGPRQTVAKEMVMMGLPLADTN